MTHEGKRKITVRRDDFLFNSSSNKWNEVIGEFSQRLGELTLANVSDIFQSNFSTTNGVSSVVSQIVLMDAMQKYFQFDFVSLCTIPEIKLLGTTDDWIALRDKVRRLGVTLNELGIWYGKLEPILAEFIEASQGRINYDFWSQIYKGYFMFFFVFCNI